MEPLTPQRSRKTGKPIARPPRRTTPAQRAVAPAPTAAQASPPPPVHRLYARFACLGVVCLALFAYTWIVSAGYLRHWPAYTYYFDLLADGFLCGQTDLAISPRPDLLSLADPYDPQQSWGVAVHDASLYHQKYYLYWGPFPALTLAAVRALPIHWPRQIPDCVLVFIYAVGLLLFNWLLLARIKALFFSGEPWWSLPIALLAAALATPVVFLLARAAVYEAAILAGQCCLIGGFYCAVRGVEDRLRPRWLLLAGIAWSAAVASRFSLSLAIAGLGLLLLYRAYRLSQSATRQSQSARRQSQSAWPLLGRSAMALLLPLVITVAGLAVYNQVRFGSPGEFGTRYQLANLNGLRTPPDDVLVSTRYIGPNLYRYLFEGFSLSREFPFIRPSVASAGFINRSFDLPPEYLIEPTVGIGLILPFALFALGPPLISLRRILPWRRRASSAPQAAMTLEDWVALCLVVMPILAMLPALCMLASTLRYLADVAPGVVLLAAMGMWQLMRLVGGRRNGRALVGVAALMLSLAGGVIAMLISVTGAFDHFAQWNPTLFEWMRMHFHI